MQWLRQFGITERCSKSASADTDFPGLVSPPYERSGHCKRRLRTRRVGNECNRDLSPIDQPYSRGSRIAAHAASLIPNLDLVAIRVGDVGVRAARTEIAPPEQLATSALRFLDSYVDVRR